ncbi:endo-beta-1 4-glucanase D [Echria macrotheca]|uniref:lytic cellulose monooxygenase (C4-dehydrogenating) n=1 Tax=Echria macrotheca TaxID=438768 RepID=A0AAJ0BFP8_9PEZI|nr:endo-beta-1 4-glucanase D [Echria macrotheca]
MRFTIATFALAFAGTASAHATMFGVSVNGVDQGDGRNVYIRTPLDNGPVKDLASPNLACNTNGGEAAPSFVKAAAGDRLTFEWQHDNRGDDIIDPSHVGPIITYIAPFTTGNGAGPIWSKIAQDGFSNGVWAVDKLIANKGKNDFTLPANLAPGKYLVRQEIIALHEAETAFSANAARGAQFYPSCVQFEISGSGTVVPNENFDFNTGYTFADPGIVFNIYTAFSSYPIPGPAVFSGNGGGNGGGAAPPAPAPTSRPGSAPTAAPPAQNPNIPAPPAVQPPTTLQTSVRPSSPTGAPATQPSSPCTPAQPARRRRR